MNLLLYQILSIVPDIQSFYDELGVAGFYLPPILPVLV